MAMDYDNKDKKPSKDKKTSTGDIKLDTETKEELIGVLTKEFDNVESTNEDLNLERKLALEAYNGEYPKKPEHGRSSVVSKDVFESCQYISPEMVKVFLTTKDIVKFTPKSDEDTPLAEQMTAYSNYIFNEKNNGYLNFTTSILNGLLLKTGYLKTTFNKQEEVVYEEFNGINLVQLSELLEDDDVEVIEQTEHKPELPDELKQASANNAQGFTIDPETGEQVVLDDTQEKEILSQVKKTWIEQNTTFDLKIKRTTETTGIDIETPYPENMLVSGERSTLDECRFVSEKSNKTISDLIAMGFDQDTLDEYFDEIDKSDSLDVERSNTQTDMGSVRDDNSRDVEFHESYIRYDYDGDGITELIKVYSIGEAHHILSCENVDSQPYSVWTPIIVPNSFYGKSLADSILDIQDTKTQLTREILDNIYLVNRPDTIVYPELLTPQGTESLRSPKVGNRVNAKLTADGQQLNPIQRLDAPFVANESFNFIQHLSDTSSKRTGVSENNASLDPNIINQSATQTMVQENTKQTKLLMFIKNYAEMCLKPSLKKVIELTAKYSNEESIVRLQGEYVEIDPRSWDLSMDLTVNVGLGTNSTFERIQALSMIQQQQDKIIQTMGDTPFMNISHVLASSRKIAELSNIDNVDELFPEVDEQAIEQFKQDQQTMAQDSEQQARLAEIQAQQELEATKNEPKMLDLEIKKKELELKEREIAMKERDMELEHDRKMKEIAIESELKLASLEVGKTTSTNIGA